MIFVTGGTGLVGAHLLVELAKKQQPIRALKRKTSNTTTIQNFFAEQNASQFYQFINWIDYCYGSDYEDKVFDEEVLLKGEEKRTRPEELKDLYEKLSSKDKKLEEIIRENENLRKEITQKRKDNT